MTESTEWDHKRSAWRERLKSVTVRLLFNWAITGGRAHVRYLRQLRFPADRIVPFYDVVGNHALLRTSQDLRTRSSAAAHGLPAPYFLFVGRLSAEKNVRGLLRAWLTYREQGGSWALVIVGDGPQHERLKAIASRSAHPKDIVFAGHASAQNLTPFFSFAACFVLPSTREPWGLVVNEAMAAALPVIVSLACGCAEDLVEQHRNGFVFDPRTSLELTACMHCMEKLSPQQRSRMSAASAQIIQPFSPDNFGREIARILDRTQPRAVHAHAQQEEVA